MRPEGAILSTAHAQVKAHHVTSGEQSSVRSPYRLIRDDERAARRHFTCACQSAMSRAGPVSSRMCIPVFARSTM